MGVWAIYQIPFGGQERIKGLELEGATFNGYIQMRFIKWCLDNTRSWLPGEKSSGYMGKLIRLSILALKFYTGLFKDNTKILTAFYEQTLGHSRISNKLFYNM